MNISKSTKSTKSTKSVAKCAELRIGGRWRALTSRDVVDRFVVVCKQDDVWSILKTGQGWQGAIEAAHWYIPSPEAKNGRLVLVRIGGEWTELLPIVSLQLSETIAQGWAGK